METMEAINITLDFVLMFVALWMIVTVRASKLGGVIGSTLNYITVGAVFLGIAHMLETVTFEVLHLDVAMVEGLHRLIILAGFIGLIFGFRGLSRLETKTPATAH